MAKLSAAKVAAPPKTKEPPPADQLFGPAAAPEAAEVKATKTAKPKVGRPSMLGNATSLADRPEHYNCLWTGREGSTKTTSVLTAANFGRVLVVEAEGGIYRKPLSDFGINLANVVLWPPKNSEIEITYENLEALFWELKAELMADPAAWYAVVWDSNTDITQRLLGDVRAYEYERNQRMPAGKQKEVRDNPFFTDRGDYGIMSAQIATLLRRFRDLPVHFLSTALERRDVDEDTGRVVYNPNVNPALQSDLLGYSSLVVYTKMDSLQVGPDPEVDLIDEVTGQIRASEHNRAKDRLHTLPRVLAVPTWERIVGYLDQTLTEATDEVQQQWLANRKTDQKYNPPKASGKIRKPTNPAAAPENQEK
jgi:hypothetical protein